MISLDEDALICDLAETYKIYDYRSLPVKLVATLAAGLRDTSRIKLRAAGTTVSQDTLLLACIADRVEAFRFGFTKAAASGETPPSLVSLLLGENQQPKDNKGVMAFTSADEFNKALALARGE